MSITAVVAPAMVLSLTVAFLAFVGVLSSSTHRRADAREILRIILRRR